MYKEFLILMAFNYFIFSFFWQLLMPYTHCQIQCQEDFPPIFSSKSFIVVALRLHIWSILCYFLYMMWERSTTSFFCMWVFSLPSTICWKDCPQFIHFVFKAVSRSKQVKPFTPEREDPKSMSRKSWLYRLEMIYCKFHGRRNCLCRVQHSNLSS